MIVPKYELRSLIKFEINLSSQMLDLIFEKVDIFGDRFLRIIELKLLIFLEGMLILECMFFHELIIMWWEMEDLTINISSA